MKARENIVVYESLMTAYWILLSVNLTILPRRNLSFLLAPMLWRQQQQQQQNLRSTTTHRALQVEYEGLTHLLTSADDYLHQWKPRAENAEAQLGEWQTWKDNNEHLLS